MSHATRKNQPARCWHVPLIDQLEARALLTASTVTTPHAIIPVHAEVAKTSLQALETEIAMLRQAVQKLTQAAHSTTEQAKAATSATHKVTSQVKAAKHTAPVKASTPAPVRDLADYVLLPKTAKKAQAGGGPPGGAFTPAQIETAYTVSALGAANQGQNQTIGIVDEYNDPNILADANAFSTYFKLPDFNVPGGPTLTVIKDSALGTVAQAPVGSTGDETSLDVEWAHAMAPKANILLIFVPATGTLDNNFVQLLHGVQLAAADGASVVSLSYGYYETNLPGDPTPYPNQSFIDLPAEYSLDTTYLASAPVSKIAVTVSTGDDSFPGYPGSDPNVIAVGGTSLYLTASGEFNYETAWGGAQTNGAGGGGNDALFATPTYQSSNGVNINGKRSDPDVALVADPYTGVAIYDSFDESTNGGNPWLQIGGTSLASPLFAGIIALAQQDRAAASKPLLNSAEIHSAIYGLYDSPAYSTYFHDVTLGQNDDVSNGIVGYKAVAGYDQATGVGSPIAKTLVPYLASL